MQIELNDLILAIQQYGGQPLSDLMLARAGVIMLARVNQQQAQELAKLKAAGEEKAPS